MKRYSAGSPFRTRGATAILMLSVLALLLPASAASARVTSDPVGDVLGPLDIKTVAVDVTERTVVMRVSMAQPVSSSVLEFSNGGAVFLDLLTRKSMGEYTLRYDVYVGSYAGDLTAGMNGGPDGESEWIDYLKLSRPDRRSFRVVIPRALIRGDRAGARFGYWVQTNYSGSAECSSVCLDFSPDGDEIFEGRF